MTTEEDGLQDAFSPPTECPSYIAQPPAATEAEASGPTILQQKVTTSVRPDGTELVVREITYWDGSKEIVTEDHKPDGSIAVTKEQLTERGRKIVQQHIISTSVGPDGMKVETKEITYSDDTKEVVTEETKADGSVAITTTTIPTGQTEIPYSPAFTQPPPANPSVVVQTPTPVTRSATTTVPAPQIFIVDSVAEGRIRQYRNTAIWTGILGAIFIVVSFFVFWPLLIVGIILCIISCVMCCNMAQVQRGD